MTELIDELFNLRADLRTLSKALRDVEAIAADEMDLDRHDLSSIIRICRTPAVQNAMSE